MKGERTLARRILNPLLPWACRVVLTVSIGINTILKALAARDAKAVWIQTGSLRMKGLDRRNASIPVLAAVSPKRATGAWTIAAERP